MIRLFVLGHPTQSCNFSICLVGVWRRRCNVGAQGRADESSFCFIFIATTTTWVQWRFCSFLFLFCGSVFTGCLFKRIVNSLCPFLFRFSDVAVTNWTQGRTNNTSLCFLFVSGIRANRWNHRPVWTYDWHRVPLPLFACNTVAFSNNPQFPAFRFVLLKLQYERRNWFYIRLTLLT